MEPQKSKYGLFKFSKNQTKTNSILEKSSIFQDSDSDSETVPEYQSSNLKRQIKNKINKAIEIDTTIFQYDEVYDQIKGNQNDRTLQTKVDNKPKYINNLLKASEARKREQEIRLERKIQKEREKEGDEFKDKESFVTSSYRQKLEEMRKTHEELEKKDRIDKMMDVTKQRDLSGFYHSLYKNSLFNENNNNDNDQYEKEKIVFNKANNLKKFNLRHISNDDENHIEMDHENDIQKSTKDKQKTEHNNETKKRITKEEKNEEKSENKSQKLMIQESNDQIQENSIKRKDACEEEKEKQISVEKEVKKPKYTRVQLIEKLFTKRTVGTVFEEARKRYLERKRLRSI